MSDVNGATNTASDGNAGAVNTVPDGWSKSDINATCTVLDSKRIPLNSQERATRKGEYPYYGANGVQGYIDDFIFDGVHVLLAEDGGNFDQWESRPISYLVSNKFWVNNHAHILKATDDNETKFIHYSLVHKNILKHINGGTRAKLNQSDMRDIEILRPPLPEQKKIAAILSSVDDVIEKTQAQINKLKDLKTGMMQELLSPREGTGQPQGVGENGKGHTEFKDSPIGRIPVGWDVVTLEELLSDVDYSMRSGPFGSALLKSELVENGIPYLGIDNVHVERFENKFRRFVSNDKFQELVRYAVRENDVMVTIMGTVGRCCVVPKGVGKALSSKHVWTMTLDHEKYISELLCWQINYATWIQDQFKNESQGGVMESISSKTLKRLLLPLPPKKEQIFIAQVHEKITLTINKTSNRLNGYKSLKKALMQDLLTGKVRVAVPSHPCEHGMS